MKSLPLIMVFTLFFMNPLNGAWTDIEDYFDDYGYTDHGDGWYTTWVGKIYPDGGTNKWFFHEHHEWQLIINGSTATTESITVWGDPMKWYWYSTSSYYPDIWRTSDWRQYTYDEGTSNPREFYDHTAAITKYDLTQSVPSYQPSYWSTGNVQYYNNCYNYGSNCKTDDFAQPGHYSGGDCYDYGSQNLQCSQIHYAIGSFCDNSMEPGDENGPIPPGKARVYLLVWDDEDYHFVRQDSDGYWSHKNSRDPARNDAKFSGTIGDPVVDPESESWGFYQDFCGYYYITSSSSSQGQSNVTISG